MLNLSEVIDLSGFANGAYWVRIRLSDGGSVVRQVLRIGEEWWWRGDLNVKGFQNLLITHKFFKKFIDIKIVKIIVFL